MYFKNYCYCGIDVYKMYDNKNVLLLTHPEVVDLECIGVFSYTLYLVTGNMTIE